MKMRYSTEPKDTDFCTLLKTWEMQIKSAKSLSNKYHHKRLDAVKKSKTDTIKAASKREIQTTAEATGDLIGNKITDKITSITRKPAKELRNSNDHETEEDAEITTHKKRYISPE